VVCAAAVVWLVHALYSRQEGPLLVQGERNLRFVEYPLVRAIERHGFLRPPLYPALLWAGARVGFPPLRVNEVLFLATLALVALYVRRALPGVHPIWPVLLLAVADANYANLHQPVAETLFVALLLALTLGLLRDAQTGDGVSLGLLAAALAGLGLTRYFALFFPAPVVGLNLLLLTPRRLPARLARTALVLTLGLAPLAGWMALARARTGYVMGEDRQAVRHLPEVVSHWRQFQGFSAHLGLTGKTLAIDALSPTHHAGLAVVTRPYGFGPIEIAGLALAGAAGLGLLRALARARVRELVSLSKLRTGGVLITELVIAFYAATLLLWTLGNNDPINTRFLYPSYALLVLAGFHGFALVTRHGGGLIGRVPFLSLYALVFLVQVWRALYALPQPIR
jgi:hypothetical protein